MSPSPAELAASVYEREPCARTFREDLEAHLINGYVFSTREFFVMGRVVRSTAAPEEIVNPWVTWNDGDAWLVYLMAGDVRKACCMLPYELPLIGWERQNVLRFWPLKKVRGIYACKFCNLM
jgi:hypothetical protein